MKAYLSYSTYHLPDYFVSLLVEQLQDYNYNTVSGSQLPDFQKSSDVNINSFRIKTSSIFIGLQSINVENGVPSTSLQVIEEWQMARLHQIPSLYIIETPAEQLLGKYPMYKKFLSDKQVIRVNKISTEETLKIIKNRLEQETKISFDNLSTSFKGLLKNWLNIKTAH